ncbi:MAG: cytochrome c maturation protein CcmE [Actinomycetes bacterium]
MSESEPFDDIGTSPDSLDLSPRETSVRQRRQRRPWLAMIVLLLVVVAGGVVLTKFLTSAIDYYCNVNEIGHKDGCEAGRRLRIQGVVDSGSVTDNATVVNFSISFGGVSMPVTYEGEPGGIFKECIPVVVHGILVDGVFNGDRIEVKHSNKYAAENPDRIAGKVAKGSECSP